MRQWIWLVLLALAAAAAARWWYTVEMPRRAHEREAAAEAAAIQAERADALYRWRDDAGNLHVTDEPPKDHRYERISRTPQDGMAVDGAK